MADHFKTQLSAFELGYVVKDLKKVVGGKISRVYMPDEKTVTLQVHVTGLGKHFVTAFLPGFLYMAEGKRTSPDQILGFCTFLRKHIENTRIVKIEQKGFERVVVFDLEGRDSKRQLIVELFAKGNMILVDEKMTIIGLWRNTKGGDELRGGVTYNYPALKYDISDLKDVTKAFQETKKDNVEMTLAVDLGLGGGLAQEVCSELGFDSSKKLPADQILKVFDALQKVFTRKADPRVIYETDIVDVIPCAFTVFDKKNQHKVELFSYGVERLVNTTLLSKVEQGKESVYDKEVGKVENLLKKQTNQLQKIIQDMDENTAKAEAIYTHYQEIKEVMDYVKALEENMNWDEIADHLKDHKLVKGVNAKEKNVLIEL
jgi:predicted ribosome quality control (RQC) complex YloA/Tae2 family protein